MRLACLALMVVAGCGPVIHESPPSTAIFEPIKISLPPEPADVPADKRIVLSVSECEVEGERGTKTPPGIYMTQEMAMRVARVKGAYDELRGLYAVDLRTIERERAVYERQMGMAEAEIEEWRERSRRSWFEKNRGWLGLSIGLVVGAGFAVGMAATLDWVVEGEQ